MLFVYAFFDRCPLLARAECDGPENSFPEKGKKEGYAARFGQLDPATPDIWCGKALLPFSREGFPGPFQSGLTRSFVIGWVIRALS